MDTSRRTWINPVDANAWYLSGNLYFQLRRPEEAVAAWEKSTDISEDNPFAYRNLANAIFLLESDTLQAISLLEKLLNFRVAESAERNVGTEPAGRMYIQAMAYKYKGEEKKSNKLIEEALKLNPDVVIQARMEASTLQ